MKNKAVQYGLIYGVISIIITMITYFMGPAFYSNFINMAILWVVTTILAIAFIILSIRHRKSIQGGFITFKEAFQSGFITLLTGIVISTLFTFFFFNVIDPSYAADVQDAIVESTRTMLEKFGAPEEQAEKQLEKAASQNPFSLRSLFTSMIGNIIFYGIVALIVAAIMKKKDPQTM